MKTQMKIALIFTLALAAGIAGSAAIKLNIAQAEESGTRLFLPSSYEEYLPLTAPTDAAFSDGHIAIADGSKLYVFDRAQNRYSCFTHSRNVTKLQFTPDGRLFFSDQDAHLYSYDYTTESARMQSDVPCATFVISGETLYTTAVANNITTFYALSHAEGNLDFGRAITVGVLETPTSSTPRMFIKSGTLYCAVNSFVHAYTNLGDGTYEYSNTLLAGATPVSELTSVCVLGEDIYYTVSGTLEGDGLYRTELGAGSARLLEGAGYLSLTSYNNSLYCVRGTTVTELRPTENGHLEPTGYEIAAGSSSANRLRGANETVRARNIVVTADNGNGRVSVYDLNTEKFTLLECGYANHVATDGNVIAAAVNDTVLLYEKGKNEPYYTHVASGTVTGVAVVYGKCYYTTEIGFGMAEHGAEETYRGNAPTALVNDAYGNLYVSDMSNNVMKYTEADFTDGAAVGALVTESWVLPASFKSLRADYEGNLYYLYGGSLYMNGVRLAKLPGADLVYRAEGAGTPAVVSFALGYEDNSLYLQFGSFMAVTTEITFPTLSNIATEDIYSSVYSVPTQETLKMLDIPSGTTAVNIDLLRLNEESKTFAYQNHERTKGGRGVLLGEAGKFSLVALFENHDYTIALFPTENCIEAEVNWTAVKPDTRYLTNDVAFTYYPCLSKALTMERLPRGEAVTLHATIDSDPDKGFDFAYIETRSGEFGYVPLSYLTESVLGGTESDRYRLGYLKANPDGVTFRAENGDSIIVKERTQVKIYEMNDGRILVRFTRGGVVYSAQVTASMLESGNPNALRNSLIIGLCVVAVVILAAYVWFVPRKKRK